MELARERVTRDRLISTDDGVPLGVVTEDGVVTDTRPVVPVARFGDSLRRVTEAFETLSRAAQKSRIRDAVEAKRTISPREYDRHEQREYGRRKKKMNARYQRKVRDARMDRDTLLAQIRVATGQTSASPALVANARKALEARVAAVQAENPGMTDEQAAEVVFTSAVIGQ